MRAHLRNEVKEDAKRIKALLRNEVRFLKTWASKPLTTGAVSPSGRFLARAMADVIDPAWDGPIIELGPGTGAVTAAILERGISPQRLIAVEYNPDFAAHLREAFPGVTVITGDAYSLEATLKKHGISHAAGVVSSLPLFTRPPEARTRLLRQAMNFIDPGRPFVQFSYALVPPVPAVPGHWTLSVSDWILRNLPPARVWTYRKDGSGHD